MSDLLNVSIMVRPDADLPDVESLLRERGATLITTRLAENGRVELIVVVEAINMDRLADALPAGATCRTLGVRGNLS